MQTTLLNPGQTYIGISHIKHLDGVLLIGEYRKSAIKADEKAIVEYI